MQRVNVVVASPGDVSEEREAVLKVFVRWNQAKSAVMLHPVMWESAGVPTMGDHPQHILDQQLLEGSDLLVAVFWARLGTPTPSALSGTLEEIREFIGRKGADRAMLYFCTRALPHDVDLTEVGRVRDFRDEMRLQGLVHEYSTVSDFEGDLYRHLDAKVASVASEVVDEQVEAFQSHLKTIGSISEPGYAPDLQSLIDESTHLRHNVWAQLIVHRMIMRALLRRLCTENGMEDRLTVTHSLTGMLELLANAKVIDRDLFLGLERVRDTTFAAEWGTGSPPTNEAVRFVLNEGVNVLTKVQRLISPTGA